MVGVLAASRCASDRRVTPLRGSLDLLDAPPDAVRRERVEESAGSNACADASTPGLAPSATRRRTPSTRDHRGDAVGVGALRRTLDRTLAVGRRPGHPAGVGASASWCAVPCGRNTSVLELQLERDEAESHVRKSPDSPGRFIQIGRRGW